jgi:hypothetical protein
LGTEGARGVDAEAEQGLAGPAPMAPATIASVRGSATPGDGHSRLEAAAPQRNFLFFNQMCSLGLNSSSCDAAGAIFGSDVAASASFGCKADVY